MVPVIADEIVYTLGEAGKQIAPGSAVDESSTTASVCPMIFTIVHTTTTGCNLDLYTNYDRTAVYLGPTTDPNCEGDTTVIYSPIVGHWCQFNPKTQKVVISDP
jgi:hypothetical protein